MTKVAVVVVKGGGKKTLNPRPTSKKQKKNSFGTDHDERIEALEPYQVDEELMDLAKSDAVFLHCLPAHRGEEVVDEVIDGPKSLIWDEAENRLHAQKSILAWCFGAI